MCMDLRALPPEVLPRCHPGILKMTLRQIVQPVKEKPGKKYLLTHKYLHAHALAFVFKCIYLLLTM